MNAVTVLLILAAGLANAQLNFEGNPLTENTDYAAEESRQSQRTARQEETARNVTTDVTEGSQKLRPTFDGVKTAAEKLEPRNLPIDGSSAEQEEVAHRGNPVGRGDEAVQTARHLSTSAYNQGTNVSPAEVALNSFLNSKTPEESRQSLDSYLQNSGSSQNALIGEQSNQQSVSLVNQQQLVERSLTSPVNQQQNLALSSPVNQHLTAQLMQQRQMQAYPVNQQQYGEQIYNVPQMSTAVGAPLMQQQLPYGVAVQQRSDVFYPPGWHHRMRRIRGKPFPLAQSRGGPGLYNGPVPVPFKQKTPIEVIYTKPPGFHRGPPPIANPPLPYEDASAWFPEADQPPPSKDVYYSQLYAQSYDPHYYNYIAKTGKIKPHLYGKLGKYHEDESNGIWAELYRGFKKHGLKNIMTPTFLLGMTLPVVTLMLTALVQKRSLGRSASWEFSREETIQEYLEQVQRAVECYEKRRRKRDVSVDDC